MSRGFAVRINLKVQEMRNAMREKDNQACKNDYIDTALRSAIKKHSEDYDKDQPEWIFTLHEIFAW